MMFLVEMAKKIDIEFERGGRFSAELQEEEAPKTADAIWNALPIILQVKHAMWSGTVIYGFADIKFRIIENAKRILRPGEIALQTHFIPLGPANKPIPREILIAYDYRNLIEATCGFPAMVNHFATITEGDLRLLVDIGTRIREKGMERATLVRKT